MAQSRRAKSNGKSKSRKPWMIVVVSVIAMVVILALLEAFGVIHILHKKVPVVIPVNQSQSVKAKTGSATSSTTNTTPSTQAGTTEDQSTKSLAPSNTATAAAIAPYGTFVSNHTPGQNGSPTEETSTCSTNAGATCYIKFTNTSSGTTTVLPTQTTDSDGYTSWTWNSDILTSGNWKVTATATLNGQSQATTDTRTLVIQ